MRSWSKFGLILVLILLVPACGLFTQTSPAPVKVPKTDTPSLPITATVTPLSATTAVDTKMPTFTPTPTRTPIPTPTPQVAFDANANADRIRFAPYGTWVEISDTLPANAPKRYILSAMQGQVMSVSVQEGPAFTVEAAGENGKVLSDPQSPRPFWRGELPASQDYLITVETQAAGPFTLRIAIAPPGQSTQIFGFVDPGYAVALNYTDEFAPTDVQVPVNLKGAPLLTLAFIDPTFFSPATNLSEAYLQLAASGDPAIVSTCTQPSTQVAETVTGQETVNGYTFTRSEFSGAAAGNRYDQITYRTAWENKCFEVVFLIHSTNIGNYPDGTVVEFDRTALMSKFETVLKSFVVK